LSVHIEHEALRINPQIKHVRISARAANRVI
jgi:hypothetical protein